MAGFNGRIGGDIIAGCSAVWLACLVWDEEVVSSNLTSPIYFNNLGVVCSARLFCDEVGVEKVRWLWRAASVRLFLIRG